MATRAFTSGGPSGLPFALVPDALPMLSRHALEALVERLIDYIDILDGDPDFEDDDPDTAVDDCGCDEADQGDLEDDHAGSLPKPVYGLDQRVVLAATRFGPQPIYQH